jgi:hypothetical protein
MKKVLIFLLGIGALLAAGKWYLDQQPKDESPSTAKRRLDDMRDKKRVIEEDQERRIRETMQKADDAEHK